MKDNNSMLQKMVVRSLTNDKFIQNPNIDPHLIDYVNPDKRFSKKTDNWFNNLIGFYPMKKCKDGWYDFGYDDNSDDSIVYYPIFVGKANYDLENESYDNEALDVGIHDYVVMFYGSDNTSHFLRFCELKSVQDFFNNYLTRFKTIGELRDYYRNVFYWYNS